MGRSRQQGPKNLAKVMDQPRFQKVFVIKGTSRLPYLVSNERYESIVAGFERRGFTVEKAAQS
jgi:hypothetical protein